MAEDSGAFKTNPANSRQIWAFCNGPGGTVANRIPTAPANFRAADI
jgi:hypothetical protein